MEKVTLDLKILCLVLQIEMEERNPSDGYPGEGIMRVLSVSALDGEEEEETQEPPEPTPDVPRPRPRENPHNPAGAGRPVKPERN